MSTLRTEFAVNLAMGGLPDTLTEAAFKHQLDQKLDMSRGQLAFKGLPGDTTTGLRSDRAAGEPLYCANGASKKCIADNVYPHEDSLVIFRALPLFVQVKYSSHDGRNTTRGQPGRVDCVRAADDDGDEGAPVRFTRPLAMALARKMTRQRQNPRNFPQKTNCYGANECARLLVTGLCFPRKLATSTYQISTV